MLDRYHCSRDFDLHDGDGHPLHRRIPSLSSPSPKLQDDLHELIWQKGPEAHPVHGDRVRKRSPPEQPAANAGEIGLAAAARQVFLEEDEMTAWLHYQIGDGGGGDMCRELLMADAAGDGGDIPADGEHAPAVEKQGAGVPRETAVVESSETPADGQAMMGLRRGPASAHAGHGRKRKAREGDGTECQGEDAEFEAGDKRKDMHRSASTRKSRAAEVHNLAERRRRDRINKKMKALQELIPRCNKSDKVAMLDEAIEYLKSLRLQVQMMSVGCNMEPVVFPCVPMCLPPMGMGMGIGMGTGLGIGTGTAMGPEMGAGGLGHPVLQYGSFFPCAQFGPRPFVSSFHSPNIAMADQIRVQAPNQQNPRSNLINMHSTNMVQNPHIGDPYRQFVSLHCLNGSSQTCVMDEPGTSNEADDAENNKLG